MNALQVKHSFFSIFLVTGLFLFGCIRFPPPAPGDEYRLDIDEVVAGGFAKPLGIESPPDDTNRLFIVEQGGVIRIIDDGQVLPEPFLDIRGLVSGANEQGLLGLAFHPDYAANGFFFINYTDEQGSTVVARYTVSVDDANRADPASAVTLFTVAQPFANHNGGQLAFGPDGYLYIGLGDGGSQNDPNGYAQNLNEPLGSILRIAVQDDGSYQAPADNPFVNTPGADARIWAYGLRNPWRFSFDRQTGDLYIADVGQSHLEEIDFQPAGSTGGENYGWRCMEGTRVNFDEPPCATQPDTLTGPVAEYGRSEGISVTGGYVYRGGQYANIQGVYFYADFGSGTIWSIRLLDAELQTWSEPQRELSTRLSISTFGQDENGELYLADLSGGTIRRVRALPVTN
jgi:glucose/arabinose dehydrogenase